MSNRFEDKEQVANTDKIYFRSDRIQRINGQWFFSVREQISPLGPFSNRDDTILEVELYLRDIRQGVNPSVAKLMLA